MSDNLLVICEHWSDDTISIVCLNIGGLPIIFLIHDMKSKTIAFKNPFDLMEEEDVPMSTPSYLQDKYAPPVSNVHTPLPFNPYEIPRQSLSPKIDKKDNKNMTGSAPPSQSSDFASPFGHGNKEAQVDSESMRQPYIQKPAREYRQDELDENGDPPLLEDIGIEPQKIKQRIILVLKAGQPSYDMIHDPDLSGPILIGLALGCLLLFSGKVHFGDIYAMFILGNVLIYFLLNFISQKQMVPLYSIMSTMGYGLLPMLGLGGVGVFFSLKGAVGILVTLCTAVWSSFAAGNFMAVLIRDTKNKRALLIYPLFLFYVSFTLIILF